jgi:hypothetical protein
MNSTLTFTKEDLVHLATDATSTIAIRRAAAEALYQRGRSDGANEIMTVYEAKPAQPQAVQP